MSFDLKLGNNFLCVPGLPADGKGFVVWKERLELLIQVCGLYSHLDGSTARPDDPPPLRSTGSTVLTEKQASVIERYAKNINQYLQEQAIVFQQIASTIPNSLYLKIKGKLTVKEAWDALKANFKRRLHMIMIELCKQLQDTCCTENGNICTYLNNIWTMQEELASLGMILSEPDFSPIVLGSLPKSYDQFLSTVTTTASVLKQELNPEDLIQTIIDEYNWWSTRPRTKEKNTDVAFFAGGKNQGGKTVKKISKDVECYHCHKKGYKKADCWAKGGGKEGQGPKSKKDKEESKKETVSTVVEEGVWMAIANDSGDEHMADDEFNNFTILEDDIFFSDEENKGIQTLTNWLKKQLKLTELSKYVYPYDDPNFMLNTQNFTDSSDDDNNMGAFA